LETVDDTCYINQIDDWGVSTGKGFIRNSGLHNEVKDAMDDCTINEIVSDDVDATPADRILEHYYMDSAPNNMIIELSPSSSDSSFSNVIDNGLNLTVETIMIQVLHAPMHQTIYHVI
jgi:hypothetical protein